MNKDKIIYSINIQDVQVVANAVYGRELNEDEMIIMEDKIGDHFQWFDTIENTIDNELEIEKLEEANFDDYPY